MAKRKLRSIQIDIPTIIASKISEIEALECTCIQTLEELGDVNEVIICDKCKQLEYWNAHCTCGVCRDCLKVLLEYHQLQPCTCTYKEVDVSIVNPDSGLEEFHKEMQIDVKCERCNKIDRIVKRLCDYDLFEKAYIDISLWGRCMVDEHGNISVPNEDVVEKSNADKVNEDQMVQNIAIDIMMFEIIPDLESRIPQATTMSMSEDGAASLVRGLVLDNGTYFADRIARGVVSYEDCFRVSYYKKYQDETDAILTREGHEHLIVR